MNILGSKWATIENETDMFSPLCFMQDILLLKWLFKAEGIPYPKYDQNSSLEISAQVS